MISDLHGSQRIVFRRLDNHGILHEIHSLDTDLRPVILSCDVVALDAPISTTSVKPSTITVFKLFSPRPPFSSSAVHCLAPTHTCSYTLFWVGRRRQRNTDLHPHALPERWASELNSLELHSLPPFLPILTSRVSSQRGALRCTDVILGKRAAIWIRPHDRAMVSHREEHDGCKTLIAAVLPGPLNPTTQVRVREICINGFNNWTALDYDEDLGKIALGSGFRKIMIVQL